MNQRQRKREWDRGQVTVRLTSSRRARLSAIATREQLEGGPGAAIDRAIHLADVGADDRAAIAVEALERRLSEADAERSAEVAELARMVAELRRSVDHLATVLSGLAEEG